MTNSALEPVRYLLVDDLPDNLLALEGILRRDGVQLLKASSGTEALELLLANDVALALLDVQMPGMDGFELAEYMRGTERTRRVPIIFLTAGTTDVQRRFRGYEAGAVDFIQKPIEPDILRSKADVFFELFRQRQEVARQRDELRAATEQISRLLGESRRYAEALREADRRKDEFLATLAHELRNPLAPLRMGLEILKAAPHNTESAAKSRDMMDRQLTHMVRLVDDLLDISRISRGKMTLQRECVELRTIIEGAVEANRPYLTTAGHDFRLQLPEDTLYLNADRTRLTQVVSNLLNNAAKYTPAGGRVELVASKDGSDVEIRVTDNGVGVAGEMLAQIFEIFTQVDNSRDLSQGGLGIGLSIVKRLVEMHGGSVRAESLGLGRGSTFVVRLPIVSGPRPDPNRETTRPRGAASNGRRLRVLVVEDNLDGAESLGELLELMGHTVRLAHEGGSALSVAREFAPEAVFLDIGLPGMSGYELAMQLRRVAETSRSLLIALTGWGSEEDHKRSRAAGFDYHLTKPVEFARLEQVLETVKT
jgi:signal transduction histidine kinase